MVKFLHRSTITHNSCRGAETKHFNLKRKIAQINFLLVYKSNTIIQFRNNIYLSDRNKILDFKYEQFRNFVLIFYLP